jgi:hypothetical protein
MSSSRAAHAPLLLVTDEKRSSKKQQQSHQQNQQLQRSKRVRVRARLLVSSFIRILLLFEATLN